MPWITVTEPWSHVESVERTVDYHPGKHNVTAEIEAAFNARNKTDDAHNSDAQGSADGIEGGPDADGTGAGIGDLPGDDA